MHRKHSVSKAQTRRHFTARWRSQKVKEQEMRLQNTNPHRYLEVPVQPRKKVRLLGSMNKLTLWAVVCFTTLSAICIALREASRQSSTISLLIITWMVCSTRNKLQNVKLRTHKIDEKALLLSLSKCESQWSVVYYRLWSSFTLNVCPAFESGSANAETHHIGLQIDHLTLSSL